jgi:predicted helicase
LREPLQDTIVEAALESIPLSYSKEVTEVKKLLGNRKIDDTIRAYEKLISIYSLESGESAVKVRLSIEKIRNRLYDVFDDSYSVFLHEKSNLGKMSQTEFSELTKNLKERTPFHWKVDFGTVFENKGFDVVVGNPPYIEDGKYDACELKVIECTKAVNNNGKTGYTKEPLLYVSNNCGNTHAYFIERSLKLLKEKGKFGFIVPVSLVSTERMSSIRKVIHGSSSEVNYFNFDDRPAKIFSGIEHCRSTIVITERGTGVQKITTIKFQKWRATTEERY